MKAEITTLQRRIKGGGLSNALLLQSNLERLWGWKRRVRWMYQQFEDTPGRDSIIMRFCKFMIAVKETSQKDFEYLWLEISLFIERHKVQGFPIVENPVLQLLTSIESDCLKAKRLMSEG